MHAMDVADGDESGAMVEGEGLWHETQIVYREGKAQPSPLSRFLNGLPRSLVLEYKNATMSDVFCAAEGDSLTPIPART